MGAKQCEAVNLLPTRARRSAPLFCSVHYCARRDISVAGPRPARRNAICTEEGWRGRTGSAMAGGRGGGGQRGRPRLQQPGDASDGDVNLPRGRRGPQSAVHSCSVGDAYPRSSEEPRERGKLVMRTDIRGNDTKQTAKVYGVADLMGRVSLCQFRRHTRPRVRKESRRVLFKLPALVLHPPTLPSRGARGIASHPPLRQRAGYRCHPPLTRARSVEPTLPSSEWGIAPGFPVTLLSPTRGVSPGKNAAAPRKAGTRVSHARGLAGMEGKEITIIQNEPGSENVRDTNCARSATLRDKTGHSSRHTVYISCRSALLQAPREHTHHIVQFQSRK